MTNFETVVGLEIHAHLSTDSKMFCACGTGPKGGEYSVTEKDEPNVRICPICTGQPGTLPVPNKKAIEDTILLGLALGSKINPEFNFERKNYYYPDLPKAYQITSSTNPPVIGGGLTIEAEDVKEKSIELDHIHLEEDAGKLTHDKSGDFSLVDLNRAGTPLLEIITKPVLSSGKEAVLFIKNLQSILRYLKISDADMEKGQLRCDANISVRKRGAKELGTKVEVKNMNSFKMIEKAIEYEAMRQVEEIEDGKKIVQETRGWDDNKGKTTSQRSKEYANDYRYFPEPDIPPIKTGKKTEFDPKLIADRLPELPKEKANRFMTEYGLTSLDADYLAFSYDVSKYFEEVIKNISGTDSNDETKRDAGKMTVNLLTGELLGKLETGTGIYEAKVTPQSFALLIDIIRKGEISGKIAKEVLGEMIKSGKIAKEVIEEKGYSQISDEGELDKIVVQVLSENSSQVSDYTDGKKALFGFFVGQVMAKTKGQANPQLVNKLLKQRLGE